MEKALEKKLDKSTFWTVFIFAMGIIFASIGNLYITYYGGIAKLGESVAKLSEGIAIIQVETRYIKDDIKEIKADIKSATTYVEED